MFFALKTIKKRKKKRRFAGTAGDKTCCQYWENNKKKAVTPAKTDVSCSWYEKCEEIICLLSFYETTESGWIGSNKRWKQLISAVWLRSRNIFILRSFQNTLRLIASDAGAASSPACVQPAALTPDPLLHRSHGCTQKEKKSRCEIRPTSSEYFYFPISII